MSEPLPPLIGIRKHVTTPSAGTHKRTVQWLLDTGDSIAGSVAITAVDKDTNLPLSGDTLAFDQITAGFSVATEKGDIWLVNFRPLLGSPQTYTLRFDYTLASQPDKPQEPLFYRLIAAQTY
jgi:hypothetical protein